MSILRYTVISSIVLLMATVSLNAAVVADTAKTAMPDTAKVVAHDTLKVAAPDTVKAVVPDTVGVIALDTAKVVTPDSIGVVRRDSMLVVRADSARPEPKLKSPVYQGAYINVDIFNPIATLFNGGRFEFVVSFDVSLWQRLFPAVEYGMMFMNHDYVTHKYKSDGLFVKLGANYNFLNYKPDRKKDHVFGVGVRYGFSNVNYTLSDALLENLYWKESTYMTNEKRNVNVGWLEFVIGVRVQVYKSFFMGVNLQVKAFPHFYMKEIDYPVYIPGFGAYNKTSATFGLEYILSYQIPYKKKQNIVNKINK
ncbi:MAG: hypothetical protein II109_01545 [Paludibacteraceae bacterium]|nr:hypothetical protein [Paludibacteraceae bacterium]